MPVVTAAHKEARRQQILSAAQRCFARYGFHPTTMQQVCREARLSPGAVYRYFAGKDEILAAVFRDTQLQAADMAAFVAADADPVAGFAAMLDAYFGLLDAPEHRDEMRFGLVIPAEAVREPALAAQFANHYRAMVDRFSPIIQLLQARGAVDVSIAPELAVRVIAALWDGFRIQRLLDPSVRTRAFVGAVKRLLLGASAGPRAPARRASSRPSQPAGARR